MPRSVPPSSKPDQPPSRGTRRALKSTASGAVFVGREQELGQLVDALESTFAGMGRMVFLSGEPGIGKSWLADALAAEARERGATVVWGRCWEAGGAPAYWPWLQSFRSLARGLSPTRLRSTLGPGAPELARVLPELGSVLPDAPSPADVDPETSRFRLFDAATTFLKRSAVHRPIVVILDDLHAADAPSLLLLRFVANELADAHMLLVACYRDTELAPGDPLSATVAELARLPLTQELALTGLAEAEVQHFIELISERVPPEGLAAAVYAETGGNPLFVGESVRLLVTEGLFERPTARAAWPLSVPQGIREVITRRLARFPDETSRLLALAAVLGREFDLEALARLSGKPRDELLHLLDEAIAEKVVVDVPGALGHLRFSHVLVRDTLYDELPASARVYLHRQIGEALEDRYRHDLEPHLAELAHHFAHAAPAGEIDKAIDYARRAGERAIDQLAYEEAARLFELALQALELDPDVDPHVRCELLLALGDAQAREGAFETAKATFLRAAEIAKSESLTEQLARAAIGYGGRFVWEPGRGDRHLRTLLEQAIAALPEDDSKLRVRLLARLAAGPLADARGAEELRDTLSRDAVEMARRLDDPGSLAYALDARWVAIWGPDTLEERGAIAAEVIDAAAGAGDLERMHDGRIWRSLAALELGDLHGVHSELDTEATLAKELRQPAQLWFGVVLRATLATLEGRFRDAEQLIPQASAHARAAGLLADLYGTIQLWALRREQGRVEEVEHPLAELARRFPMYEVLRCLGAHVAAELGREQQARAELSALAADGFSALPRNDDWLFSLCLLVDVSRALSEATHASTLYELLLPYAERTAVNPPAACIGSVSRSLAVAAALTEQWSEAERHFEDALRANSRMGARPWVGHTCVDWAEALLGRDGPGDPERAAELLATADELARELGVPTLTKRVAVLAEGRMPAGPGTGGESISPARPSLFRREGEYWAIAYEGDAFRLKDSKGLRYLARLLAEPGRELHALDLAAGKRDPDALGRRVEPGLTASPSSDAGEILDARAKAEYRRRLAELEEEVEEARSFADDERAARAEEERDLLVAELSRALGLGGRSRRAASASERARVSVTRAIRAALARVRTESPSLGDHLEQTIRTGTFCSYKPDPRATTDWQL